MGAAIIMYHMVIHFTGIFHRLVGLLIKFNDGWPEWGHGGCKHLYGICFGWQSWLVITEFRFGYPNGALAMARAQCKGVIGNGIVTIWCDSWCMVLEKE